ncbi:GNAT family acetyltransferase [Rhodotorula taiwanensis]|uniref:GNAT family acetyltransferase n=1 Tax=Rhodotorula taiwanensis TaxID=741276 RepID=A0A2S5BIY1_9BASI|nr:GNAT family acetyltransferase [Rhodotorula taiwanensis]
MSLLRPFSALDLFEFNAINLDVWTETYGVGYYLSYLMQWGDLFSVVESAGGDRKAALRRMEATSASSAASRMPSSGAYGGGEGGGLMGYVMGKTEGRGKDWHGHVSAITVSPQHRRLGLASMMMDLLEKVSERDDAWFVDLFVRQSNDLAIGLYESLGYMIYRRVQAYYGGGPGEKDEDAYDMRKSLPRDTDQESVRLPAGYTDGRDVVCQPEDIVF